MKELQAKADDAVTDLDTADRSGVDQTVFSANERKESPLTLGRYLRKEIVGRLSVTSPGYVTEDSCGQLGPGDDTVHSSPGLKIELPPQYVHSRSSTIEKLDQYDLVDLVLLERLQERVLKMVNKAIEQHNTSCDKSCKPIAIAKEGDWKPYGNVDSSDAIKEYAQSEALDLQSSLITRSISFISLRKAWP
ncbi:hypothetical protein FRC00_007329 [Tulasnella sp. 408]|nr:hypothetical protein FRC00_007329 [Tulasnella sp. 408]